jgi:YfiH family protein
MSGAPSAWIEPEWPAPSNVRALATTRQGGYSEGSFAGLNLAAHVDDDRKTVERNRAWLRETAHLPAEPIWLQQVHGTTVWTGGTPHEPPVADASVTRATGQVSAILTADCLPVLFCDLDGTVVAAAHAGWRGLADGVLAATVEAMRVPGARLLAWLGPAIEPAAFEVGDEVLERFVARDPGHAQAFQKNARGRWQGDLYALARGELRALGIERVYGGGFGTFGDATRFYSYRRDKRTGRMATLIWMSERTP